MNDKTKSAPKEAEVTIYKCHNCGFKYYEKANYCTQCGHEQLEGSENMIEQKKKKSNRLYGGYKKRN